MNRKPKSKVEVPSGGPFVVCPICSIGFHFLNPPHVCRRRP